MELITRRGGGAHEWNSKVPSGGHVPPIEGLIDLYEGYCRKFTFSRGDVATSNYSIHIIMLYHAAPRISPRILIVLIYRYGTSKRTFAKPTAAYGTFQFHSCWT